MSSSRLNGRKDFNPLKDIPSLAGKVIFITGGTAGLGSESVRALVAHNPAHIYFTGRNVKAGDALITEIENKYPKAALTFVQMDLASLQSVKDSVQAQFKHGHLDILMNNAGIMAQPAALSKDGYEIQFATNHLGHAMLTKQLLPYLLAAAEKPNSDVRVITNTSGAVNFHPSEGISFEELNKRSKMTRCIMGSWLRYGHSKLANVLFASELARRYPQITSVSIHPGVVETPLVTGQTLGNRVFIRTSTWLQNIPILPPEMGACNQLWCAAGAKKDELKNGGFYSPIAFENSKWLAPKAKSEELAAKLWDWTEEVLQKF